MCSEDSRAIGILAGTVIWLTQPQSQSICSNHENEKVTLAQYYAQRVLSHRPGGYPASRVVAADPNAAFCCSASQHCQQACMSTTFGLESVNLLCCVELCLMAEADGLVSSKPGLAALPCATGGKPGAASAAAYLAAQAL